MTIVILLVQLMIAALLGAVIFRAYRIMAARDRIIGLIVAAGILARAVIGQILFWISYLHLPIGRSMQMGNGVWWFGGDSIMYFNLATAAAHRGLSGLLAVDRYGPSPFYVQTLAVAILAFGAVISIALLINLAAYVGTCFVASSLHRNHSKAVTGAIAAISLLPSSILWSLQPLKEVFFMFLLAALFGAAALWRRYASRETHIGRLVAMSVALALIIYAISGVRWYFGCALLVVLLPFLLNAALRAKAPLRALTIAVFAFASSAYAFYSSTGPYIAPIRDAIFSPTGVLSAPMRAMNFADTLRSGFDRTAANTVIRLGHTLADSRDVAKIRAEQQPPVVTTTTSTPPPAPPAQITVAKKEPVKTTVQPAARVDAQHATLAEKHAGTPAVAPVPAATQAPPIQVAAARPLTAQPTSSAPAPTAPKQSAATQSAPTQSTSAQKAPIQTAPTQSASIRTTPKVAAVTRPASTTTAPKESTSPRPASEPKSDTPPPVRNAPVTNAPVVAAPTTHVVQRPVTEPAPSPSSATRETAALRPAPPLPAATETNATQPSRPVPAATQTTNRKVRTAEAPQAAALRVQPVATPIALPAEVPKKEPSAVPAAPVAKPSVKLAESDDNSAGLILPASRPVRFLAGAIAVTVPRMIAQRTGLIDMRGGRGMWMFADLDTLVFDLMLLAAGISLVRAFQRRVLGKPLVFFAVACVLLTAIPIIYTIANFGTLFRHRTTIALTLALIPIAVAAESTRSGDETEPASELPA